MGEILMPGGGGGAGSDDCTAELAHVLAGHTAITKDSNDEPAGGGLTNLWGQKTKCKNLQWNKDGDGNLAIAVDHGFHGCNWDNGSYEYIVGQELRNVIGLTDPARILAGTHIAGIYGTMPDHGTPDYWLPINGTWWLPQGYFAGGSVRQNIPTHGEHWITPARHQQVASTAGHYCTGNIVVNPIPGEYWNMYEHQTVFNYGSYGISGALGAYYCAATIATSTVRFSVAATPRAITFTATGGVVQTGIGNNRYFIFRGSLPNTMKFIKVTARGWHATEGNQYQWYVVDPETMIGYSAGFGSFYRAGTSSISYDMSYAIAKLPNGGANGYFLAVYQEYNIGDHGVYTIELAPWAI